MSKFILMFTLAAATLLAQGPGGGFGPGMGPGMGPGRGPGMGPGIGEGMGPGMLAGALDGASFTALKAYLGLTDSQVASLKAALKARVDAGKPVRDQIQAKQKQLAAEMAKDNPSAAVVGALMVEMKKLRDSIQDKASAPSTDALAVLTPAQQTKLKELEAAQKLVPSIHQAELLGLLTRPEPPAGRVAGMAGMQARQLKRVQGARRAMRHQI